MKVPKFIVDAGMVIREKSPDILVVSGGVLLLAAGYTVFKLSTDEKMNDILSEQEDEINEITEQHDEEELQLPAVKKDIRKVQIKTVGRVLWHMMPAIGMAGAGFAMELAGHNILKKRYLSAVVVANASQRALDAVLERARSKYGEEAVRYLKYGTHEEIVDIEEEDENGNKTKRQEVIEVADEDYPIVGSVYSVVFDENTDLYRSCGGNITAMRSQLQIYQNGLNEQYNAGYPVWYDDVIVMTCGVDSEHRCDELRNTGWYKRDKSSAADSDGYIDLRIHTFMGFDEDGNSKQYLRIDPNVPGIISLNAGKNRIRKVGGKYLSNI